MSRILAIDPGSRRIGLAISDPTESIAQPLPPLRRDGTDGWAGTVAQMVNEQDVIQVVVGLPRNMDGSEGPAAADAREMAERLIQRLDVPVTLWDERLTTVAAQRMFRESGMKTRRTRKHMDGVAAVLILQGYLDHRAKKKKN
jgi:putative Holliday junction resolvase